MRATFVTSYMDDKRLLVSLEERLGVETLVAVLMNFEGNEVEEMVNALVGMGSYDFRPKKLHLDLKNR
ncbi:hypothetical protein HAX54_018199, partial [Datura stramonium]|nr:hypothetical protein [Datura stramonium]